MNRPHTVALCACAMLVTAITVAPASAATNGLSISPVFLEHTAQPGAVGSLQLTNRTGRTLTVAVRPRPWLQSRAGAVDAHSRRTLAGVSLSASSFALAPGQSRSIEATLTRRPAGGSLYGAVEVLGVPQGTRPANGVLTRYRLLAGLRLNPPAGAARQRVRVGAACQQGGSTVVTVRNRGNTVNPLTGSVRISGAAGTVRASIASQRVLPGKTVDLRLRRGRLPRGTYVARIQLRQGGKGFATVSRRFRVR